MRNAMLASFDKTNGGFFDMSLITKDMIIADLLETDIAEDAVPILRELGMQCLGCAMASSETIEEACQAHNVDADEIISKLKALVKQ